MNASFVRMVETLLFGHASVGSDSTQFGKHCQAQLALTRNTWL